MLFQATGSTYLDVGDYFGLAEPGRSVLALRATIGDARGGESVRPAPRQALLRGRHRDCARLQIPVGRPAIPGPHPQGGTSLTAGTIEFRQRILSSFGLAVFADAGQVAADGPPFSGTWRVGVGAGARYYTPIGPIRLDVAFPLNRQPGGDSFELYIGIGQAF